MSQALNLVSNNVQGFGPSESSCLPCLGISGRAVCVSPCPPRSEYKTLQLKVPSSKCSLRHMSFVCKASSGGQRRNPDFSRQTRHGFSRNRNRLNEERDNSEILDESEFLSTKNGPLLSLSNNPKSQATSSPGPREREIVELFRKVQARLRERAAIKEDKKFESLKGQNKESETVDSLLSLLRKHSVEQGKRKVNGGNTSDFTLDRPRQVRLSDEEKTRNYFNANNIARDEPQEPTRTSFNRPDSNFKRVSPVPRVRYEPIVTHSDEKTSETHSGSELEPEPELELDPDVDVVSGLELEPEEEQEEESEMELDPEIDVVDKHEIGELSEGELSDGEEDNYVEKDIEKQHTEVKDLNDMKLVELRALAKARGMKGFSKLKKSELIGLLNEDTI